jgi:hypothetical protein
MHTISLAILTLATLAAARLLPNVLGFEESPTSVNASSDLTIRQAGPIYSAAVIEITFYTFIDSTLNANGDCDQNCASLGGGPFPSTQGEVAHTC